MSQPVIHDESKKSADRGNPYSRILVLVVVILVVVTIAMGGLFKYSVFPFQERQVTTGQAKTPSDAVLGYLQAVARGSAADALAFVDEKPPNMTFLTDDVLAYSNAVAPISNIKVRSNNSTGPDAVVYASISLDAKVLGDDYSVKKIGEYWFLDNSIFGPSIEVSAVAFQSGPKGSLLMLNGVEIGGIDLNQAYLFPGAYRYQTGNKYISLSNNQMYVLVQYYIDGRYGPTIEISNDNKEAIVDIVNSTFNACLSEKAEMTKCGFGFDINSVKRGSHNQTIDDSSIIWSSNNDAPVDSQMLYLLQILTPDDSIRVAAQIDVDVDYQASLSDGNEMTGQIELLWVVVDISDPENVTISFQPPSI